MNVSTQLRELADVVERVEDGADVEVQGARLAGVSVDDDAIRADLTVFAPITAEEAPVEEVTGSTEDIEATVEEEEAICSECGESHENGACWDDEEEPEDDPVDEEEHACDVDGCDYSTDTERGLAIHRGRVHGGDAAPTTEEAEDDAPPVEAQVVDVLEEHGELTSADIEFYLETKSSQYWNVIASMKRAGRIETRQDPEDRRRNLYRLVDDDEEDGDVKESTEDEDPEVVDVGDEEDVAEEGDVNDVEEQEDTFPRDCHCGATLNDTFELAIHRTEEHGVPQSTLGPLEPGEFETIVREADGLQDVVDEVDWSRKRTLHAIGIYGLADALGEDGDEDVEEQSESAEAATVTDGGAGASVAEPPASTEQAEEPDEANAFDPGEYGLDREDLVAALTGAQTVYQVQRELRFDRKTMSEILAGVGLLDQLSTGCPAISPREAQDAVEGVV